MIGTGTALLLGAGAGLVGSSMQARAAKSAAAQQAGATNYASDVQRQMFETINEQQKPYREAGYGALTRIGELLPDRPIGKQRIGIRPSGRVRRRVANRQRVGGHEPGRYR